MLFLNIHLVIITQQLNKYHSNQTLVPQGGSRTILEVKGCLHYPTSYNREGLILMPPTHPDSSGKLFTITPRLCKAFSLNYHYS